MKRPYFYLFIVAALAFVIVSVGCIQREVVVLDASNLDKIDRAKLEKAMASYEPAGPAMTQAAADTDASKPEFEHPSSKVVQGPGEQELYISVDDRVAMKPLGLFGQIEANQQPRTTSMDSAENVFQVTFSTEGSDFDPELDTKGEWLMFSSTRHRQTSDIYLQRVDGAAITQLTNDPGNDVMPTFSPDGQAFAFASDRSGNWDIYIKPVAGGQPIKITDNPSDDLHPSFSPDGKRMVYCTFGSQSGQWEMVVVDLDRPEQKRYITNGIFPVWSPKGDKIVYQRSRARGTRWFSVWTIDIDADSNGSRPTELAASSNAAAITPTWSPDGDHVVFCTVLNPKAEDSVRPKQADVWVISSDGRGRTNLTNSPYSNVQPVWGADNVIYFVTDRMKNGVENIWSMRPDHALFSVRRTKKLGNLSGGPVGATKINPGPAGNPAKIEEKAEELPVE